MKKKILVVDDNRIMLKFMTELLQRNDHEVITAEDGYSALNILISFIPDILFVDLFMPKIGGDKLCQIVRKMPHLGDSYIVILSAAVAEMDFDYIGSGADACIAKGPFDKMAEHVLAAVKEADAPLQKERSKQIVGLEDVHARQMTKELLSRTRHLETILESIDEGILEVSSGIIVYANVAAVSLLGASQEELLARYFVKLFKPVDQERVKALLGPGTGKSADISPDNPVTLNNRQVTINNYAAKGKISTSIILITDVTRQNRLQFQRNHNRKMKAAAGLIYRITKDFRNQLKGIQQATADLRQETDADSPYLPKLKTIDQMMADLYRRFSVSSEVGKAVPENPKETIPRGTETILLADYDAITRQANRLILEDIGYKVLVAETGNVALEKYRIRSDKKYNKIDVVIADITLPDMDADELCDRLKQINPGVNIFFSGEAPHNDNDLSASMPSASGFIKKPFNIFQVSSKLREVLDTV